MSSDQHTVINDTLPFQLRLWHLFLFASTFNNLKHYEWDGQALYLLCFTVRQGQTGGWNYMIWSVQAAESTSPTDLPCCRLNHHIASHTCLLPGNDVYRKNAWMAVYGLGGLGSNTAAGPSERSVAWRTIRRGLRQLGAWLQCVHANVKRSCINIKKVSSDI